MSASKYSPITLEDEWFIGSDKIFEFTIYTDDDVTAEDIDGWDLEWVLRQSPRSDQVFITKSTGGNGIAITDGNNGLCTVTITDTDTLGIIPGEGEYWHSLKRTNDTAADVLVYGEAAIRYAATR